MARFIQLYKERVDKDNLLMCINNDLIESFTVENGGSFCYIYMGVYVYEFCRCSEEYNSDRSFILYQGRLEELYIVGVLTRTNILNGEKDIIYDEKEE